MKLTANTSNLKEKISPDASLFPRRKEGKGSRGCVLKRAYRKVGAAKETDGTGEKDGTGETDSTEKTKEPKGVKDRRKSRVHSPLGILGLPQSEKDDCWQTQKE